MGAQTKKLRIYHIGRSMYTFATLCSTMFGTFVNISFLLLHSDCTISLNLSTSCVLRDEYSKRIVFSIELGFRWLVCRNHSILDPGFPEWIVIIPWLNFPGTKKWENSLRSRISDKKSSVPQALKDTMAVIPYVSGNLLSISTPTFLILLPDLEWNVEIWFP